jgi:hypothetical protein
MWVEIATSICAGVLLLGLAFCTPAARTVGDVPEGWTVHTSSEREYGFRIEYPAGWRVEREGAATHFRPPGAQREPGGVTVVVFDEERTPPLAVSITYTPVRVIEPEGRAIPVYSRSPSAATERYLVRLHHGRLTAEIRSVRGADNASTRASDAVFDHMALSFSLTP